jgi:hypothetical protein
MGKLKDSSYVTVLGSCAREKEKWITNHAIAAFTFKSANKSPGQTNKSVDLLERK